MILLITNKYDISIDFVVRELISRNTEFVRINAEDLPRTDCTVRFPEVFFSLTDDKHRTVQLNEIITAILFRRPGKPFEWDEADSITAKYCSDQWGAVLQGLLMLPAVKWVNNPMSDKFSESKIVQLKVASEIGFAVPRTCITSEWGKARLFFNECGNQIIAKALETPLIVEDEQDYFIYSTLIESFEEIDQESISISPTIFQEYISNKIDIRVTVIGERIFPVKIEHKNGKNIEGDWRCIPSDLMFTPCELPAEINALCMAIVKKLGLIFGAIDLVQNKEDHTYYFLEINPRGEWGWIEAAAGQPIAKALVDELVGNRTC